MANSRTTAKAHAKVILLGEHFVVPWSDAQGVSHPGSPALVIPLMDLSTEVSLEPSERIEFAASAPGLEFDAGARDMLEQALRRAASRLGRDLKQHPLRIEVRSDIPISRGFGSSAAFSVALCRALSPSASDSEIEATARDVEGLFHGRSSGLDISGVMSRKPVYFSAGSARRSFENRSVDFLIVDSGPREGCSRLVQKTLEFRSRQSKRWTEFSDRITELVKDAEKALKDPEGAHEVAAALTESHTILRELGLVPQSVDGLIQLGTNLGALSGKISGAGQGGAVLFAALPGSGPALANALIRQGAKVLGTLGAQTAVEAKP